MVSFVSYECFEELDPHPSPLQVGEGNPALYFSNKIIQEVMCKIKQYSPLNSIIRHRNSFL